MNTHLFIIGNGFSINLINKLGMQDSIDLVNLFRIGDRVMHPDDKTSCFLSRKYCPDLWGLGAKSTLSAQESNNLIRDIITSMNVCHLCIDDSKRQDDFQKSSYYKAYCQLVSYLRLLFIYYNNLVNDEKIKGYLTKEISLINYIDKLFKAGEKVRIITYNYDIFLERMLKAKKIKFKIAAFDKIDNDTQIVIFKPHGSISFVSKTKRMPSQPYNVEKNPIDSTLADASTMKNDLKVCRDTSNINPIIPPAGDGDRIQQGWSHDIKCAIQTALKTLVSDDQCTIYGVSYDNVDRREIDQLITNIPWDISIRNINPYPSSTFDMVLGSIFKNYTHYKDFYMEA